MSRGNLGSLVQDRIWGISADVVLQHLSERELLALRRVSRHAYGAATRYLIQRMATFQGLSSVIPTQGTSRQTLAQRVIARFDEIQRSRATARVMSDQITDATFFNNLMSPRLTMVVNVGTRAPREGVGSISRKRKFDEIGKVDAEQVQGPTKRGKAHAKFISGGGGVLVASPNLTPTGLSGDTVESGVMIHSPLVQAFFRRYHELMRGRSEQDARIFADALRAFNMSGHRMSLALAPFVSIQPWLLTQVQGYDRIIIRMFLISYLKPGNDIVTGLNLMVRNNPGVTIDVYVDQGQVDDTFEKEWTDEFTNFFEFRYGRKRYYRRHFYVWEACQRLMDGTEGRVRVFTQTGTNGIMHDKLILASRTLPATEHAVERRETRVILGSSGFSTHVMGNENYDVMVRIDEDELFEYMMNHHRRTVDSGRHNTKRLVHKP